MRTRLHMFGLLTLAVFGLTAMAQSPKPHRRPRRPAHRVTEQRAPNRIAAPPSASAEAASTATPAPPVSVQQTPAASAPVPPQVTYSGGELTISTPNSTLADVLDAVKQQTGAKLEVPPSASQDRIAAELGPGPPRDVLARLLAGSRFDYILLGSAENPQGLSQIIVTQREAGPASAPSSAQAAAPAQSAPEEPEIENEETMPVEARPLPPPMRSPMPEQNAAPAAAPTSQPTRVKTPEQLLQELQRMQQQEQQRRQNRQAPPPQ